MAGSTQESNKKVSKPKPIKFRQTLFWDVDPKNIDPQKHAKYIIERILEFGKDNEVRWMFNYYPRELVKDRIRNSRGVLSPMSKNFWTLMLKHI